MRSFRSDNNAGICDEALRAIERASASGHAIGYGDDEFTRDAEAAFRDLFGEGARAFFVATGTAANGLAVAAMTEPWQRVLCHAESHWNDDESTAPELLTGCRSTAIHPGGDESKLTTEDVRREGGASRGDVHQPAPGVLTISNPTEFGTVYTPDEMRALCDAAREAGYRAHVDGARFANAVAHLLEENGGDAVEIARALTIDAGVDALSFGGTKNGLAMGEAIVFFPQDSGETCERAAARLPFLRKRAGQLLSKHRFVSAPFAETLRDGVWLKHAGRANAMARRLSYGMRGAGFELRFPTQSNGVFVVMPDEAHAHLRRRGHEYYMFGDPAWRMARLMCSFDTREEDVDRFIEDARRVRESRRE